MHYCQLFFLQLPIVFELNLPHSKQIEHCLREWESGVQSQVNLDENVDATRYRTHISNAVEWEHLNEEKTTLVRKHISTKLLWVHSYYLTSDQFADTFLLANHAGQSQRRSRPLGQSHRKLWKKRKRCWRTVSCTILRRRFRPSPKFQPHCFYHAVLLSTCRIKFLVPILRDVLCATKS